MQRKTSLSHTNIRIKEYKYENNNITNENNKSHKFNVVCYINKYWSPLFQLSYSSKKRKFNIQFHIFIFKRHLNELK